MLDALPFNCSKKSGVISIVIGGTQNIFGVIQNGCNLLLYLTNKRDFEILGGAIAQLHTPWLRA